MLNYLSTKISNFFLKKSLINYEQKEILVYGFQLFFSTLFGSISILLLSILFFEVWYALIFFAVFMPLRVFSGGYHAKTYLKCFVISNLIFLLVCLLSYCIPQIHQDLYVYILSIISCIYIFIMTPIENNEHKISKVKKEKNKKRSQKIVLLQTFIIIAITFIFKPTHMYMLIAVLSMSAVAIMMQLQIILQGR